jgi:uncharacterized protein involved in exopolysaccharide biosynthesis/Mrp family chromosome partitioning ATPase
MGVGAEDSGKLLLLRESDLDLSALGRRLWEKKWRVILPALAAAVLSFVIVNTMTPKYKSEARVLIDGRENVFLRPEADKTGERAPLDQEALTSQVQLLLSRDVALQVIRRTKLTESPEFDPVLRGVSLPSVLLSMVGLAKDRLRMTPEERALEVYYTRLTVLPIERSRVISVEFESADPQVAARVANAIVDTYLVMQQENRIEQTRAAGQWLAGEIASLRDKVAEAEGKVERFRAKSNLFLGSNNTSLANQQLSDLTAQLATARAHKADIEARAQFVRGLLKSGRPIESSDSTGSELIRRLTEQRVALRAQLAEQSTTLLDGHPRIKELKAQLAALDGQLRAELERLSRALDNDAKIAAQRVETTIASLDNLKRATAANGSQDVQLRALEREAKAQRDLLESYLAKYREATARESIGAAPTDARTISRALVSNVPASPKKIPIILISTLVTMFLAMTFVVAGEFLGTVPGDTGPSNPVKRSIRIGSSVLDLLRRRVSATAAHSAAPAAARAAPAMDGLISGPPLADVVRGLRALGEEGRKIGVIGVGRNVGATHTAISLARALASGLENGQDNGQDARVVLVDLAFKAPNLGVISTQPGAPGIANLIRGQASFGSIITRDQFSRVHLISAGDAEPERAQLLSSPRLTMTMAALARAYRHVVVDAGAIDEMDVALIARLTPRIVLVSTDLAQPETRAARDRLLASGFSDVTVFLGTPSVPSSEAA